MKYRNVREAVTGSDSFKAISDLLFSQGLGVYPASEAFAGMAIAGLEDWGQQKHYIIGQLLSDQRRQWSLATNGLVEDKWFANYILFAKEGELWFGAEYTGCAEPELEFKLTDELIDNLDDWGLLPVVRQMLLSTLDCLEGGLEWDTRYNLRIDPSVKILTMSRFFADVHIAAMAKYA